MIQSNNLNMTAAPDWKKAMKGLAFSPAIEAAIPKAALTTIRPVGDTI